MCMLWSKNVSFVLDFVQAFTYVIHDSLGVILHSMSFVYKIPLVPVYTVETF